MARNWSDEDIESILRQLDAQNLPFQKYAVIFEQERAKLLGRGSSANVYRAESRTKRKGGYALKVIGFGDRHVDSLAFRNLVEAQKDLGMFQGNVVKILDSAELLVWIEGKHAVVKAERIGTDEDRPVEGNCLRLQFVVMEESTPVCVSKRGGRPLLRPERLAAFNEEEILKLAYDIGTALAQVHARKLIHRDVKLENVFYSAKEGRYKLGDFGIARTTDDGLASTVAFTKGYGAPEVVGTLEDKYDCTADIYSFGMLLYVLLNELRFPGSVNYHPNVMQYTNGFLAEDPTRGSDELCRIVMKMISFHPDDRYQTMDEVLNEFDKLRYGRLVKYQREHKATSLVLGVPFALLGAVMCQVSFGPAQAADFSVWMYLFFGLCVWKGIGKFYKKDLTRTSILLCCLGIFLLFSTGFSLWGLLLVLFVSFMAEFAAGVIGGVALLMNLTCVIMNYRSVACLDEYRWIAVLLLSLSAFLLFYNALLEERDDGMTKMYLGRNLYWIVTLLMYLTLLVTGAAVRYSAGGRFDLYERLFGRQALEVFLTTKPILAGAAGAAFCVVWIVREWILLNLQNRMEK